MSLNRNLYYDLPKYLKLKVNDLCHPVMKVCGAHQKIDDDEGSWTVLWLFDNIEFYSINVHFYRSRKSVYIKGFRNKRLPDVNEQLKFFVNQLKSVNNSTVRYMDKSQDENTFTYRSLTARGFPKHTFDESFTGIN